MKDKFFVDTNVLVYLFDNNESQKQSKCTQLLADGKKTFVWSTQVIQEFYQTMTKKMGQDPLIVKETLAIFNHFELVVNNYEIIKEAIDVQVLNKLSFWDSLIVSAAKSAKCTKLISEDLHHQQQIGNLMILSPFESIN
ncbi:MAG: PIN domain-containing protein [Ekhidna sp.]|nr:PIN domain-containing protein [Ekhidna sp.]